MSKFYAVRKGITTGIFTSWDECSAQVKGFPGAEYKSFSNEDDAKSYMSHEDVQTDESIVKPKSGKVQTTVNEVKMLTDDEYDNLSIEAHSHLDFLKDNGLILSSTYDTVNRQIDTNIRLQKERQSVMQQRGNKPFPDHIDVFVDGSYNKDTNEYGYGIYMNDGEKKRIICGRGALQEGGNNVEGEITAVRTAISDIRLHPQYKSVTVYYDYKGIQGWAEAIPGESKRWDRNKSYTAAYGKFIDKVRASGLEIDYKWSPGHTGIEGNEFVDKLAKMACGVQLKPNEQKFISQLKDVPGYPNERELPALDEPVEYNLMGEYMNI